MRERLQQRAGLRGESLPLGFGDAPDPDCAGSGIEGQPVGSENLGKRAGGLPPQVVELEQPILGHGVAEADEELPVGPGLDVGYSPGVPVDLGVDVRHLPRPLGRRHSGRRLLAPPRVELGAREPGRLGH